MFAATLNRSDELGDRPNTIDAGSTSPATAEGPALSTGLAVYSPRTVQPGFNGEPALSSLPPQTLIATNHDELRQPATLPPPPAPTVAVAAAPVRYNVGGDVEQWRGLVASIFPAFAVEPMLRIIQCESGGNPLATGAAGERGLAQIHPIHADSDYDPRLNLLAAYRISGGGTSWSAWSCVP